MKSLITTDTAELSDVYILVMDEHVGVLTMLEALLRPYGIIVLFADSGAAAVKVFREHSRTISVVLLEVQMSGLDGPQTLTELRKIAPEVLCCFMSASLGKYSLEQLLAMGVSHVFDKPFRSVTELAETLKSLAQSRAKTTLKSKK